MPNGDDAEGRSSGRARRGLRGGAGGCLGRGGGAAEEGPEVTQRDAAAQGDRLRAVAADRHHDVVGRLRHDVLLAVDQRDDRVRRAVDALDEVGEMDESKELREQLETAFTRVAEEGIEEAILNQMATTIGNGDESINILVRVVFLKPCRAPGSGRSCPRACRSLVS